MNIILALSIIVYFLVVTIIIKLHMDKHHNVSVIYGIYRDTCDMHEWSSFSSDENLGRECFQFLIGFTSDLPSSHPLRSIADHDKFCKKCGCILSQEEDKFTIKPGGMKDLREHAEMIMKNSFKLP